MSVGRHWAIAGLLGLAVALYTAAQTLRHAPGFLMDRAIARITERGAVNTMAFAPLATDRARAIVRPSPDLAYASCPFDVSKGPVVVEALPVAAPYWSLSVFDDQTDVAFVRNNRQSARQPIRVAILKAGMAAPPGYEPVPVTGDRGIALIRILVADRTAFPALDEARRLSSCHSIAVGP